MSLGIGGQRGSETFRNPYKFATTEKMVLLSLGAKVRNAA